MLKNVEEVAEKAGLQFHGDGEQWSYVADSPHISPFIYEVTAYDDDDSEDAVAVGSVDGYRIAQDWTLESDAQIWEEADAIDDDVVQYVDALIRELRACHQLFHSPEIVSIQRIVIVRHVQPREGVDAPAFIRNVAASIAMMDAPVLMMIDPVMMPDERQTASGKLKGRSQVPGLLDLGFVRMVGSRCLWGWNRQMQELEMREFAYDKLVAARREGELDGVIDAHIGSEVYGDVPSSTARLLGIPGPDDLMDD